MCSLLKSIGYLTLLFLSITPAWATAVSPEQINALMRGIILDNAGFVAEYLQTGNPANITDDKGNPALIVAILHRRTKIVRLLLEHQANVNQPNAEGTTPLMLAAASKQTSILWNILNAGATVNATHPETKQTALMYAVLDNHLKAVQMLLDAQADVTLKNQAGKTAQDLAKEKGFTEIYNLLNNYTPHAHFPRIALVIGNAAYQFGEPLRNPTNDAIDVATALRDLKFKVIYKENASQQTMEESIIEFGRLLKADRDSIGVFYYAGHGVQLNGENYLIPVSMFEPSAANLRYRAVAASYIAEEMRNAGNIMNVMIFDACRDNPFDTKTQGLAEMRGVPNGSLIVYSTAPNDVASDGTGRNSPFTKYFLQKINDPTLGIEALFKEVRIAVSNETRGRQIPWAHSSLLINFSFADTKLN